MTWSRPEYDEGTVQDPDQLRICKIEVPCFFLMQLCEVSVQDRVKVGQKTFFHPSIGCGSKRAGLPMYHCSNSVLQESTIGII